jgi:hypothetical protein
LQARRLEDWRHPNVFAYRKADMEIGLTRSCDSTAQGVVEVETEGPADRLTDQEAMGIDVVAVGLAGGPVGGLVSQGLGHSRPIEHRIGIEGLSNAWKPRLMRQQHS